MTDNFTGTAFEGWNTTTDQTVQGWVGGDAGGAGFDIHENRVSHNINEVAPGVHAAAFVKAGGWHNLGTIVDHPTSTADLMKIGYVDYEVFKSPAVMVHPDQPTVIDVPNTYHTWRRNPVTGAVEVLGTVSAAYPVFQNADCFQGFGDAVLAESHSQAASCAALFGGRVAFMCWKLDREIIVADNDLTELWMMARTSHDKSTMFDICVGPLRTACGNTMRYNVNNCVTRWSVRHTRNAIAKSTIEDVRTSLKLTYKYADAWEAAAKELVEASMSADQFDRIIGRVFGPELGASKQAEARWTTKRNAMMTLFTQAPNLDNVRGTAYAAVNAVGEWADWGQGVKAKDPAAKALLTSNPDGYRFVKAMVTDSRDVVAPKQQMLAAVAEWAAIKIS